MTTFTTESGTTFKLTRNGAAIHAEARGLNLGQVRFNGKDIETVWLVREVGNKRISAPVPATAIHEVAALFATLEADVDQRFAENREYDRHVSAINKLMTP